MYKWWHEDYCIIPQNKYGIPLTMLEAKKQTIAKLFGIEGVFDLTLCIMDDTHINDSWTLQSIKEGKLGVCTP